MKIIIVLVVYGFMWRCVSCQDQSALCLSSDPDCLLRLSNSFLSSLGGSFGLNLTSLDPLLIDTFDLEWDSLNLNLNSVAVFGLKNCLVTNALLSHDLNLDLNLDCCLTLNADAFFSGSLLGLPVNVTGDLTINAKNLLIDLSSKLTKNRIENDSFFDVVSFEQNSRAASCANFDLINEVDGIGDDVNVLLIFINKNAVAIFNLLCPKLIDIILDIAIDLICAVLAVVPVDKIIEIIEELL